MSETIMKQFNLDEYSKNPSRKVVTRDGRNARIICTDAKGDFPIVALIETPDGFIEFSHKFKKNGHLLDSDDHSLDLFFSPEKHEGWINVYKAGNTSYSDACIWPTEEEAKKWANDDYIATVKIEWEE